MPCVVCLHPSSTLVRLCLRYSWDYFIIVATNFMLYYIISNDKSLYNLFWANHLLNNPAPLYSPPHPSLSLTPWREERNIYQWKCRYWNNLVVHVCRCNMWQSTTQMLSTVHIVIFTKRRFSDLLIFFGLKEILVWISTERLSLSTTIER